ncbi:short chain dehydrogenase [Schumannella luteola]|uniref:NAD(P)-dependent dehydrogenase (Short-subunit alcohol dehydrogenase family) n=1 Tax=Schumannella luteola TaxID=472059 RepID=A0A852YBY3_9MICO|nr:short chain dehydrogenase [Schumannella luteola]NYG98794.1 NAD(P)-dependent dehydrogenase (short-subunit alcohol dehydrogenase family) [Schumannella luteola]TPW91069.1 short chain dehydrogenase [Schumannella luteola]
MKIAVLGASGHIGSSVVDALRDRHEVVAVTRSSAPGLDATDAAAVTAFFESIGELDAVVAAFGSVAFKPLAELTADDYRDALANKALAQISVAQEAVRALRDGGSITLTSGILAREAIATGAAASAANGAIESYVIGAAAELPRGIRINAVSPTVLLEATGYHSAFPGFKPVPAADVALAYVKSIEGVQTGRIFAV